jgi:threonine/homoserine/homoserine lactone efflux protein
MPLLRIFFTGLFISFLGCLPLGTLNVAAMQISVTDGVGPAINFSLGALLVEMLYVRVSIVGIDWMRKQEKFFRWFGWFSVLIVVALAVFSFVAAADPHVKKNVILSGTMHKFWLGVTMSAINPMQVPFWFGWSSVLFTKKVLLPRNDHYNVYISGIGTGTFIGNAIFIFGGQFLVNGLNAHQKLMNWIIGCIFTVTALIMIWKMSRKKSSNQLIS